MEKEIDMRYYIVMERDSVCNAPDPTKRCSWHSKTCNHSKRLTDEEPFRGYGNGGEMSVYSSYGKARSQSTRLSNSGSTTRITYFDTEDLTECLDSEYNTTQSMMEAAERKMLAWGQRIEFYKNQLQTESKDLILTTEQKPKRKRKPKALSV